MYREAQELLDELHIDVNPKTEVRRLSIAHKQLVEIARALSMDARIIIMDEPTSSLPTTSSHIENEVEVLLRLIDRLRQRGKGIVYISHRMDEIFRISDRITVLRDGKFIGVRKTADNRCRRHCLDDGGTRAGGSLWSAGGYELGDVVFEARDLNGISFNARAGEIVGLQVLSARGEPIWR